MGVFLESSCVEVLLTLLTFLTLFYYWATFTFDYWKKRNILFAPPVPLFGTSLAAVLAHSPIHESQMKTYLRFKGHPIGGTFAFREPRLMILDPGLIEAILIKDFSHFYNRGTFFDEELDPLSAHLVNLRDQRWKSLRNKLTPVFSTGKLRLMHEHLMDCVELLVEHLRPHAESREPIEAREAMAKFSTDVIGNIAFGINMNAIKDPDSGFRKVGKVFFGGSQLNRIRATLGLVYPKIIRLLKWKSMPTKEQTFFIGALRETVKERETHKTQRNDFLQLLINMRENEKKSGTTDPNEVLITENVLLANSFVFFAAGFETTASTLSYCLFELAHNQSIQDTLFEKISEAVTDKSKATYDILKEISYLDQVIHETLRKYPPVSTTIRQCTKTYRLPGHDLTLPVGQMVTIPIHSIHHDPDYYPNPEKFDPYRFHPDNAASLTKNTFLPFGTGPRVCIGERFAMAEIKAALTLLLLNFKFLPSVKTSYSLKFNKKTTFLVPQDGLWINIRRRA